VDERCVTVPAEVGEVPILIVRPLNSTGPLPTIL